MCVYKLEFHIVIFVLTCRCTRSSPRDGNNGIPFLLVSNSRQRRPDPQPSLASRRYSSLNREASGIKEDGLSSLPVMFANPFLQA